VEGCIEILSPVSAVNGGRLLAARRVAAVLGRRRVVVRLSIALVVAVVVEFNGDCHGDRYYHCHFCHRHHCITVIVVVDMLLVKLLFHLYFCFCHYRCCRYIFSQVISAPVCYVWLWLMLVGVQAVRGLLLSELRAARIARGGEGLSAGGRAVGHARTMRGNLTDDDIIHISAISRILL